MVQPAPGLGDGRGVAQHGDRAVDGGEGALGRAGAGRDHDGLLVVDAELEACRAPLDKVEGRFGLEAGHGSGAVAGDDVAAVEERDGHVLAVAGVADHHLVVGFEALEGQVVDLEALVGALGCRDDRRVADQRVVDAWVRDQVSLELVEIDVQRAIEPERRGD